jgi:2-oxoglutarate dehydrogenase E1 component
MASRQDIQGVNLGYVLELYDRYRQDPDTVDAATRAFFAHWTPPSDGRQPVPQDLPGLAVEKIVGAVNLAQAIREFGHLAAQLDPLGSAPHGDPSLDPATYSLSDDDLRALPASLIAGPAAEGATNAFEALERLRAIYAATTGYEFGHVHEPAERAWLREAVESGRCLSAPVPIDPKALLERLIRVDAFEQFLHRSFPGKTRFSIEGVDVTVPMLDEVVGAAAQTGTRHILIGMAHRGRLNVLAHILNRPYAQLLAEFKDPTRTHSLAVEELGWTGDVKYHIGGSRVLEDGETVSLTIALPPNPSHLEHTDPIIEGMARALGTQVDRPGAPTYDPKVVLPILIHGDAAFPAQGVVAETLNLARLPGYYTGGTLHIIANNQLGYTTDPHEGRSTHYASDLAKGFEIPIVHVNADDPVACISAARLARAYTEQFERDFVIDLIGYRRYGHNEGDEPSFTQPVMYTQIEKHPRVWKLWADRLLAQGQIAPDEPGRLFDARMAELQTVLASLRPEADLFEPQLEPPPPGAAKRVKTAVPVGRLRALNDALLHVPEGFALNPKLERAMRRRRESVTSLNSLDEATIDWATAEMLAFASILEDGIPIRLTGEDTGRGTFSQRHAVFHDIANGAQYIPLQALPQAKAAFEVHDSPLSENAVVGFEYGYNVQTPDRLVLWEAQYGDFINAAQVMVDEYITSARAKWGQTPSLVLLLPHAWEGQGPDHSGGRLERWLQLASDINMRVANCTTAAQYFHLLRRQAILLKTDPLPLIIMTPKSLLRHPLVNSPLRDLVEGRWQTVIDDVSARQQPDAVRRLILCSGKVYVDLVNQERRQVTPEIAIARVEQLYRFPADDLQPVLEGYPNLEEVVWVQEEPENMGAWSHIQPRLSTLIAGRWPLRHVSRPSNASPAEGSAAWHAANQKRLIERAYNLAPVEEKALAR